MLTRLLARIHAWVDRRFAADDAMWEAEGMTVTRGTWSRSYRDPRFDERKTQ